MILLNVNALCIWCNFFFFRKTIAELKSVYTFALKSSFNLILYHGQTYGFDSCFAETFWL